jgi:hypothetical protein
MLIALVGNRCQVVGDSRVGRPAFTLIAPQ